jgi:hypothetical protein
MISIYANRRSGEQEVVFELNDLNAGISNSEVPAETTRKDKHPLAIMVSESGVLKKYCSAPGKHSLLGGRGLYLHRIISHVMMYNTM